MEITPQRSLSLHRRRFVEKINELIWGEVEGAQITPNPFSWYKFHAACVVSKMAARASNLTGRGVFFFPVLSVRVHP